MRERGSLLLLAVVTAFGVVPAQAIDQARPLAELMMSQVTHPRDPPGSTTTVPTTSLPATSLPATPTTTTTALTTTTAGGGGEIPTTTTTVGVVAPQPLNRVYRVRHILWPVPGYLDVASTWGADRDGGTRLHRGNDILAPKLTPVVAVANGTIGSIRNQRGDCCWIVLNHDDGWSSWYLHLNNDTLGSDNGRGNGIRPDLVEGTRVAAGEVIGWIGDSGNAEPGPPHLHFELHMPGVGAIDPYPSLRWARNNTGQPAFATAFSGAFIDDDGLRAEPIFELLTTLGASTKCEAWGGQACPMLAATELETAAWLGTVAGVEVVVPPPPPDAAFVGVIGALYPAPCEQCPPPPMTRGQLMTMILWSLRQRSFEQAEGFSAPEPDPPWEINPAVALAELHYLDLVDPCPLLDLPLDSLVSRAQVAETIGQAFGLIPPLICGQVS